MGKARVADSQIEEVLDQIRSGLITLAGVDSRWDLPDLVKHLADLGDERVALVQTCRNAVAVFHAQSPEGD
jgi:hypothetical protein